MHMSKKQRTTSRAYARRKFRAFWTETEKKTQLYSKLKNEFDIEILYEQALKMEAWSASKRKNASLLRFGNWMRNYVKFKEQREEEDTEIDNILEEELEKSRQKLAQYGHHKRSTN